jgi:hypothetical protein
VEIMAFDPSTATLFDPKTAVAVDDIDSDTAKEFDPSTAKPFEQQPPLQKNPPSVQQPSLLDRAVNFIHGVRQSLPQVQPPAPVQVPAGTTVNPVDQAAFTPAPASTTVQQNMPKPTVQPSPPSQIVPAPISGPTVPYAPFDPKGA